MQQCFSKLKQIVPTVHVDQKLSKVQLLQHVIDYIMDLELTLQYQQQQQTPVTTVLPEHRKPLSENSYLNTMVRYLFIQFHIYICYRHKELKGVKVIKEKLIFHCKNP